MERIHHRGNRENKVGIEEVRRRRRAGFWQRGRREAAAIEASREGLKPVLQKRGILLS
jgi:hypothetical protein